VAQPATLSICLTTAPAHRRAQAVATWTAALGVGGIIGNLAAGAILSGYDWPAFFLAFVPAAVLLAVLVAVLVPAVPRHPAHAAPLGTVLLVAGLFAVLFGIIEGPERGWAAPAVLGGFAAGAVLLGAFVWHGLVGRHPLVDPRVFAHPGVRAGALGVGAGFFALFGLFFANAQFLQDVKGYSTLRTGIAIVPLAAGIMAVSARGAALAARFGARLVVGTGLGCIVGGLLLMSTAGRGTPYPLYAVYLLLMAAGMGLSAPSLTAAVLGGLPPERAGLGSGINSAAREIGAALGVAVVGTVLNAHNALGSPAAFVAGMSVGYRILSVVLLIVGAAVVLMWRHPARPRSGPAAPLATATGSRADPGVPLSESGVRG
jgi:MFS family permease